jgi:hypothetical protein
MINRVWRGAASRFAQQLTGTTGWPSGRTIKQNPAWGAGFCLLGWRGWRALPLQALTQFVNIHIRDAFLGTSRCGRERRYARQFRRLLVTHPRSAHSQSFARTRLRSAPITLSLRACRRPEAAPLSFRRFPWLASPESRVISRMRLFA